jgi:hypothetical protein
MANLFETLKKQSIPGATADVAKQQQAGNVMQMVQAAKQAAPTATSAQIAAAGAGMATQQSKQVLQNLSNTLNEQQKVGEMEQRQQAANIQNKLAQKELNARQELQKDYNKLAVLDRDLSNKVMGERNKYVTDSAGLKYLNQKQLLDLKLSQAKSQQELMDYQQKVENLYKRKVMILETAYQKITSVLENQALQDKMNLTIAQKKFLAEAQKKADEKLVKERKKAAGINGQRQLLSSVGSSLLTAGIIGATGGAGAAIAPYLLGAGGATLGAGMFL